MTYGRDTASKQLAGSSRNDPNHDECDRHRSRAKRNLQIEAGKTSYPDEAPGFVAPPNQEGGLVFGSRRTKPLGLLWFLKIIPFPIGGGALFAPPTKTRIESKYEMRSEMVLPANPSGRKAP